MSKQYILYLNDFYLEELVEYKDSYRFAGELLVEYLSGNPDLKVPADLLDDCNFKQAFHQGTDFTLFGSALLTLEDGKFKVNYDYDVVASAHNDLSVESLYLKSILGSYTHAEY